MAVIYSTGFDGIGNAQKLQDFDPAWFRHPTTTSTDLIGNAVGAVYSSAAATTIYYTTGTVALADCVVACDLVSVSGVVGAAGVTARTNDTAQSCYGARYNAGNVQLFKLVAGTYTQLGANYAASFVSGATHRVGVRCVGNQIYATWDGADVIGPVTDSSVLSGYAGIRTAADGSNLTIDNFSVDNLAATNTSPSFTGPNIADISGTEAITLTPVDVSARFFDSESGLTFSAIGSWPDGVTVSSAGVISGTPTTEGAYSGLQVRATDAGALTADSNTFSITVAAAALPSTITVTDPLKNNTGTLLASISGVRVAVLEAATLACVYETSGLTTNASGILATISDAAIITGQQYHVAIKLADGSVGITGPITAS